jgi:hypothetical protein
MEEIDELLGSFIYEYLREYFQWLLKDTYMNDLEDKLLRMRVYLIWNNMYVYVSQLLCVI